MLKLRNRHCPKCGGNLRKDILTVSPMTLKTRVYCKNEDCSWDGSYRKTKIGSIPTIPNLRKVFFRILEDSFRSEEDATKAWDDFEQWLLQYPHGDPDEKGHKFFMGAIRNLVELWALSQMIDKLGLRIYQDQIINREISRRFPDGQVIRAFTAPTK